MFEQNRLTDRWFIMDTFATIAVSTSADFIKERTIDFVHFCTIHF